jgi:ABC-type glycerol-3-phosphate transport system substrate-binding protein
MVHAGIAAAAVGILLAGCASGTGSDSPTHEKKITLTFQSLAYQDPTVAATKDIVDAWNAKNPDIHVKLVQGSWDSVHDQLVTQLQGGTAPDIIHDESADIAGFAEQGYLADLGKYLSADVKKAVSKDVWKSVTDSKGEIVAAPTLLQSYVVFANTDALAAAGVDMPTGKSLSWDDFMELAKKTTSGGKFGLGWGLKSPTATVMNLALGFGGGFFDGTGADAKISVGDPELAVPKNIHDMAFVDKSLDPVTLTQGGSDVLPGFYAGKYAMYVGGNYIAQSLTSEAPAGFHWAVLPPLKGSKSIAQAANPQTLSVSAQSKHVKEAAEFINFFMSNENLAKVAQGDWLIPSSQAAQQQVLKDTKGDNGWTQAIASAKEMKVAPFQQATNYPQWKDQIATPALQQYFANQIGLDDLKKKLTDGWAQVNG